MGYENIYFKTATFEKLKVTQLKTEEIKVLLFQAM